MRLLVTGSRYWTDAERITRVLDAIQPTVLIEGEARGADAIARDWALAQGWQTVRLMPYRAEWRRYGRGAGVIRNQRMLTEGKPDLVVAFHDNLEASKGTADMVRRTRAAGTPLLLVAGPLYIALGDPATDVARRLEGAGDPAVRSD